jgi:hypothetical protein
VSSRLVATNCFLCSTRARSTWRSALQTGQRATSHPVRSSMTSRSAMPRSGSCSRARLMLYAAMVLITRRRLPALGPVNSRVRSASSPGLRR